MRIRPVTLAVIILISISSCKRDSGNYQAILPSPDFDVHVYFQLFRGYPYYMVYFKEQRIFDWSALGFKSNEGFPLDRELQRQTSENTPHRVDSLCGASDFFSERKYNTLIVHLHSTGDHSSGYSIEFRTFKKGFAFRYHLFPQMDPATILTHENSEFALTQRKHFRILEKKDTSSTLSLPTYDLPVYFLSSQREKIEIAELKKNHPYKIQLVQKEGSPNVFTTSVQNSGEDHKNMGQNIVTSWRIVRFEKAEAAFILPEQ